MILYRIIAIFTFWHGFRQVPNLHIQIGLPGQLPHKLLSIICFFRLRRILTRLIVYFIEKAILQLGQLELKLHQLVLLFLVLFGSHAKSE